MPKKHWQSGFIHTGGSKMKAKELKEQHEELSKEVDRLSKIKTLTPSEEKNLVILKKLKLSYKDALLKNNKISYDD